MLSRHFVEKGRSDEFIAVHSIQVEDEETRVSGDGKWVETGLKVGAIILLIIHLPAITYYVNTLQGSYTSSMHVLVSIIKFQSFQIIVILTSASITILRLA